MKLHENYIKELKDQFKDKEYKFALPSSIYIYSLENMGADILPLLLRVVVHNFFNNPSKLECSIKLLGPLST